MRKQRKMSAIQTLFETCKEVFANGGSGFVPPPPDVERLRSILDGLKQSDVGLSPDMPYFRSMMATGVPIITYLPLYECPKFSMGIFCLPPCGVLPLHNHPGMTVFTKILFGTLHIKSYDWVNDVHCSTISKNGTSQIAPLGAPGRLAKLEVNGSFTAPCDTSILYPTAGGNMHCFTASTPCAILDVLGPPYSDAAGRRCTYFREFPFDRFSVDGISVAEIENEKKSYAWLQEREKPENLIIVGSPYIGPKIVHT